MADPSAQPSPSSSSSPSSFSIFSHLIDARLLRAIADQGFATPTPIQLKAIPLALESRDILAQARTGSGKTAAYSVPAIQKVLNAKKAQADGGQGQVTRVVVLVPTRELAEQVLGFIKVLVKYCEKEVEAVNVASGATTHLQHTVLSDKPDVVVGTPSRVLGLLQSKSLALSALETLIIDEADLILSYGHAEDMQHIFSGNYLPTVFQSILMSATLSEDISMLQSLTLRDPIVLNLSSQTSTLNQYVVRAPEIDKFLLTYVILKLKLIPGKCIIFVNDVDRSYRLKLFLEQFSVKSCVLNSELPLNSRYHVVQEFNRGVYDYVIATDEGDLCEEGEGEKEGEGEEEEEEFIPTQRDPTSTSAPESKKRKRTSPPPSRKKAKSDSKKRESGVTRGVDFIDVSCVLNFDLPTSARSYTHRVGRTARAGRTGMSLSYVVPSSEFGKNKVVGNVASTRLDEHTFSLIASAQQFLGAQIHEYKFNPAQIEAFRYRMEDALRAVTRKAIKEARVKELKAEILNSERLKVHFEDNPLDLEFLRHDGPLHPTRVQPHMKHVPKYLLPRTGRGLEGQSTTSEAAKPGFVPFKKQTAARGRGRGRGGSSGRGGGRKKDPLKRFGK